MLNWNLEVLNQLAEIISLLISLYAMYDVNKDVVSLSFSILVYSKTIVFSKLIYTLIHHILI